MPAQSFLYPVSLEASTDLSGSHWCFVTLDWNGQLALPTAGASVCGVLQDKPAAQGAIGAVAGTPGAILRIKYGGAVPAGSEIATDEYGRAVVAASGDWILGRNMKQVGVTNEIGEMFFQPAGMM